MLYVYYVVVLSGVCRVGGGVGWCSQSDMRMSLDGGCYSLDKSYAMRNMEIRERIW